MEDTRLKEYLFRIDRALDDKRSSETRLSSWNVHPAAAVNDHPFNHLQVWSDPATCQTIVQW